MNESIFLIVILLGLIPIIFFLNKLIRIKLNALYIVPFVILVVFSSFYELLTYKINYNTSYWSRFYLLLEFIALFYYFFKINFNYNNLFKLLFAGYIFLFFYLLYIWDIHKSYTNDSYLTIYESIFVLISSILWIKTVFYDLKDLSLLSSPHYYFISGFILYFSGTFFLFLMSDFMMKKLGSQFLNYWNINIIFGILLRTLLIIGLWKATKK